MALRRYKTLEEVRDGHGRQVGQFAGIEERTPTGIALFEPDMRLLGVDQSIHRAGARLRPVECSGLCRWKNMIAIMHTIEEHDRYHDQADPGP